MLKVLQHFLDRLSQRLTVIVAQLVSSSVATLQATEQAQQQSRLEDLARRYEADGKPGIAAALRQRADALTSTEPADEALPILANLVGEAEDTPDAPLLEGRGIDGLPDLGPGSSSSRKSRRKRPSAAKGSQED